MSGESATNQSGKAYACKRCEVAFGTRQKLQRHVEWHHDTETVESVGEKVSRSEWLSRPGLHNEANDDA